MGYHLNCHDVPGFKAVSKPLLTEFGIHHRLESCAYRSFHHILRKVDRYNSHMYDCKRVVAKAVRCENKIKD